MKKILNVTTTIMLVMLLGLAGCNNIFSPNSGSADVEDGKGLVRLQLSVGRTLLPTTINFESFTLTFTPEEGEAVVITSDDQELDEAIELAAGEWTLEVEIFSDAAKETKIAWAEDIAVTIVNKQVANVPVNLEFDVTEGDGTFKWDIDLEDFEGGFAELTLTLLTDDDFEINPIDLLDEEANSGELKDLPAGYYLVTVMLENETDDQYAGWVDIMHIYPSQVTELTLTLSDFDFYGKAVEIVTITFDAGAGKFTGGEGSGTNIRTVIVDKGDVVAIPSDVALEGFNFIEWNDKDDGTGTKLAIDTAHDADTTYYAIWEEIVQDPCEYCDKFPCECPVIFSLAEYFEANAIGAALTSSSPRPLRASSGSAYPSGFAIINGNSIEVPARAAGRAYDGIDIHAGAQGSGSLQLNTLANLYTIRVKGSVAAPIGGMEIQIRDSDATRYNFSQAVAGTNAEFDITGELPEDSGALLIRIRSNDEGMSVPFLVTFIEIVDRGPRGGGVDPEPEIFVTEITVPFTPGGNAAEQGNWSFQDELNTTFKNAKYLVIETLFIGDSEPYGFGGLQFGIQSNGLNDYTCVVLETGGWTDATRLGDIIYLVIDLFKLPNHADIVADATATDIQIQFNWGVSVLGDFKGYLTNKDLSSISDVTYFNDGDGGTVDYIYYTKTDILDIGGEDPGPFEPVTVFSLADWLENPPATFTTSSSPRPLAGTSSSAIRAIVDNGINITGRSGNHHTVAIWIDNSTATASNGGGSGLNLDPVNNLYEITVAGSIIGTPPEGAYMELRAGSGHAETGIKSNDLSATEGVAFTMTGILPSDLVPTELRILPSPNTEPWILFRITSIEVVDLGPR